MPLDTGIYRSQSYSDIIVLKKDITKKKMKNTKSLIFCAAIAAAIFPSCSGKENPDNPDALPDGVVIRSSASFIAAGGNESVTLTVYADGVDVTSDEGTTIFIVEDGSTSVYESTTWSSSEVCEVQFFASYNAEISERITVRAVSGAEEVPEDPDAINYDFVKNTIILQATSVGCQYCPYLISALDEYSESGATRDNAIIAAAHANMSVIDPMTSTASLAILNHYTLSMLPTAIFDLDRTISLSSEATSALINSRVNLALGTSAKCGISAVVTGTEAEGKVSVTARVKVGRAGNYRVAAWLLEDGIVADQYNSTSIPVDNIHDNAIRAISCSSPVTGEYLDGQQSWEQYTEGDFYCEFDLEKAGVDNLGNCHVVIFVTSPRTGSSTYLLDNAVDVRINESIAYQYED